jgi:signal transduction histidine kinase
MKWNSFRARLSLWNSAVLALILGGFGLVLYSSIRRQMLAAFDHELAVRGQRFATGPLRLPPDFYQRHLPPPGPPFQPLDPLLDPAVRADGSAQRELAHEHLASLLDGGARRLALVRRPHLLDRDGHSVGPFSDGPWDQRAFRAALTGQETFSTIVFEGERLRVFSVPRRINGEIVGVAQVASELGALERSADSQFNTLLMLLPLSLLAASFGGLFLAERALRPVRAVTHAATQISEQDLSRRLTIEGEDELAELSYTFNSMISRLEAAFQSRERAYAQLTEAYEQQRRFTADASHELRTPLSRIKISASMALSQEQTSEEYRRALEVTDIAADAMERLIRELLLLARADAGQLAFQATELDLAALLCDAVAEVRAPGRATVSFEAPSRGVVVCGDRNHLRRVFDNLLENALRHTPADGRIVVSVRCHEGEVVARVADTGEGISPEHLPHVMERFYRVDAARSRRGGGCGLGLAIAQSIVAAHHGSLKLESRVGCGTTAIVALPTAGGQLVDGEW